MGQRIKQGRGNEMDKQRRNIVTALMVAMFLGAVEGTVVTTATPTIAKSLNGFELISWVFSAYLLTSAISTPIYGKLSDLFGRKRMLSIGIVIFLTGSSLCGISGNMYQLIGFRALQGLGAGAIFTVTYTIVGDIFNLTERATVQGWLGSVWGIASVAGPFLGGFLIDFLSWHWIFFINIPFGIISIILLNRNLKEDFEKKKHRIDYAGTLLLSVSILSLLYGILIGGESSSGYTFLPAAAFMLAAAALIGFYFVERKAQEPVIPFDIFTRTSNVVNIISFLASAVLIGADVYLPIYIQNVLGFSATISGLSMAPMSISWLPASVILAKAIPKYGEKMVIGLSALILLISCGLLMILNINSPLILVIIFTLIMGIGFGGAFTALTIVVQSSVGYNKRGAATASNSLIRTLGQTIGVSIFGGLFNANIMSFFSKIGITGINPDNLYSQSGSGVSMELVKSSINSGVMIVIVVLVIVAAACMALSFLLRNDLKEASAEQ